MRTSRAFSGELSRSTNRYGYCYPLSAATPSAGDARAHVARAPGQDVGELGDGWNREIPDEGVGTRRDVRGGILGDLGRRPREGRAGRGGAGVQLQGALEGDRDRFGVA